MTSSEILPIQDVFCLRLKYDNPRDRRVLCTLSVFFLFVCFPLFIQICAALLGFVGTYQFFYRYGATKTGEPVWGMLQYDGWHLHHWCCCVLVLLLTGIYTRSVPPLVLGACFGGIVHGIQFSDWSTLKHPS